MNIGELIARYDLLYQGRLLLRIVLAAFVGYLIGYERMNREKSAGMRTHAIVCLGSALMWLSQNTVSEISRITMLPEWQLRLYPEWDF